MSCLNLLFFSSYITTFTLCSLIHSLYSRISYTHIVYNFLVFSILLLVILLTSVCCKTPSFEGFFERWNISFEHILVVDVFIFFFFFLF